MPKKRIAEFFNFGQGIRWKCCAWVISRPEADDEKNQRGKLQNRINVAKTHPDKGHDRGSCKEEAMLREVARNCRSLGALCIGSVRVTPNGAEPAQQVAILATRDLRPFFERLPDGVLIDASSNPRPVGVFG